MHTTSLIHSLSICPVPLPPSSSHHHPPATGRTAGWLTQTHAAITAQAQLKKREGTLHHRSQQTAMSDHASKEEVVRRVEAKLKIARQKGEFGNFDDTEEKILSIARNTCGRELS